MRGEGIQEIEDKNNTNLGTYFTLQMSLLTRCLKKTVGRTIITTNLIETII